MRKGIAIFLLNMVLAAAGTFTVPANEMQTVISVEEKEAKAGDTVEIQVSIENNTGIAGLVFRVEYPDTLEMISVEETDNFAGATVNSNGDGFVGYAYASARNCKDVGELMKISFRVKENASADSYEIKIANTDVIEADLNTLDVKVENGSILVLSDEGQDAGNVPESGAGDNAGNSNINDGSASSADSNNNNDEEVGNTTTDETENNPNTTMEDNSPEGMGGWLVVMGIAIAIVVVIVVIAISTRRKL